MKPLITMLEDRISAAMTAATGRGGGIAQVRLATDPKFGDYQVNGVMALAKELKTDPHKLAEDVVEKLDIGDICEPPEVAGPGFINLRLRADFIADRLLEINADTKNRLAVEKEAKPKTIVVDFSGPNIAKQMHVGHLRSTIIGDCICRTLEFLGHKVIRQNHIGDWGTQFGILIQQVFEGRMAAAFEGVTGHEVYTKGDFSVSDMEELYRKAKKRDDSEPEFAQKARQWVVKLQQGNLDAISFWKSIVKASLAECQEVYDRLGAKLTEKDVRGESFYAKFLPGLLEDTKFMKFVERSDGARCVFPAGFKNKEGDRLPLIIGKSDGAFPYAATDLAAVHYRVNTLKADRIIYVTDARQSLHFQMVFSVVKKAGWVKNTELVHVTFGSVLGEGGRPLKTREGENVKLKELLDEAVERAEKIVDEKNPELSSKEKAKIAKAVGIGAVKYADYSNNRTSDYIFSFDKMLAMDGNTAPYMQYAYARIKSIERKAQSRDVDIETELAGLKRLSLTEPSELDLAKHLIRYGEAIEATAADYRPNYLTAYLYELAQKFSVFYTNCPVLQAEPDKRPTRLLLCDLTAKTIKHGLSELLGIEVVKQM